LVTVNGRKHWLWRAVDQHGAVLDVLVRRPRNKTSAKRLMRELVKRHGRPRVIVTDELRSYAAANNELGLHVETSATQGIEKPGGEFAPAYAGAREGHATHQVDAQTAAVRVGAWTDFESVHSVPLQPDAQHKREARTPAIAAWERASCPRMAA
jgi:putative transposase